MDVLNEENRVKAGPSIQSKLDGCDAEEFSDGKSIAEQRNGDEVGSVDTFVVLGRSREASAASLALLDSSMEDPVSPETQMGIMHASEQSDSEGSVEVYFDCHGTNPNEVKTQREEKALGEAGEDLKLYAPHSSSESAPLGSEDQSHSSTLSNKSRNQIEAKKSAAPKVLKEPEVSSPDCLQNFFPPTLSATPKSLEKFFSLSGNKTDKETAEGSQNATAEGNLTLSPQIDDSADISACTKVAVKSIQDRLREMATIKAPDESLSTDMSHLHITANSAVSEAVTSSPKSDDSDDTSYGRTTAQSFKDRLKALLSTKPQDDSVSTKGSPSNTTQDTPGAHSPLPTSPESDDGGNRVAIKSIEDRLRELVSIKAQDMSGSTEDTQQDNAVTEMKLDESPVSFASTETRTSEDERMVRSIQEQIRELHAATGIDVAGSDPESPLGSPSESKPDTLKFPGSISSIHSSDEDDEDANLSLASVKDLCSCKSQCSSKGRDSYLSLSSDEEDEEESPPKELGSSIHQSFKRFLQERIPNSRTSSLPTLEEEEDEDSKEPGDDAMDGKPSPPKSPGLNHNQKDELLGDSPPDIEQEEDPNLDIKGVPEEDKSLLAAQEGTDPLCEPLEEDDPSVWEYTLSSKEETDFRAQMQGLTLPSSGESIHAGGSPKPDGLSPTKLFQEASPTKTTIVRSSSSPIEASPPMAKRRSLKRQSWNTSQKKGYLELHTSPIISPLPEAQANGASPCYSMSSAVSNPMPACSQEMIIGELDQSLNAALQMVYLMNLPLKGANTGGTSHPKQKGGGSGNQANNQWRANQAVQSHQERQRAARRKQKKPKAPKKPKAKRRASKSCCSGKAAARRSSKPSRKTKKNSQNGVNCAASKPVPPRKQGKNEKKMDDAIVMQPEIQIQVKPPAAPKPPVIDHTRKKAFISKMAKVLTEKEKKALMARRAAANRARRKQILSKKRRKMETEQQKSLIKDALDQRKETRVKLRGWEVDIRQELKRKRELDLQRLALAKRALKRQEQKKKLATHAEWKDLLNLSICSKEGIYPRLSEQTEMMGNGPYSPWSSRVSSQKIPSPTKITGGSSSFSAPVSRPTSCSSTVSRAEDPMFDAFQVIGLPTKQFEKMRLGDASKDAQVLYSYPSARTLGDVARFAFPRGIALQPSYDEIFTQKSEVVLKFSGGGEHGLDVHYGICVYSERQVLTQGALQGSVAECYCLITHRPALGLHFQFLWGICNFLKENIDSDTTTEKLQRILVQYLSLKLPSPGEQCVFNCTELRSKPLNYHRINMSSVHPHLPDMKFGMDVDEYEFNLQCWALPILFGCFSLDIILQALGCALHELHVVVISERLQSISGCVLGLSSLLAPMKWAGVTFVSLPASMEGYLESPVPILLGYQGTQLPRWFQAQEDMVVLFPDRNELTFLHPDSEKKLCNAPCLPKVSKLAFDLQKDAEELHGLLASLQQKMLPSDWSALYCASLMDEEVSKHSKMQTNLDKLKSSIKGHLKMVLNTTQQHLVGNNRTDSTDLWFKEGMASTLMDDASILFMEELAKTQMFSWYREVQRDGADTEVSSLAPVPEIPLPVPSLRRKSSSALALGIVPPKTFGDTHQAMAQDLFYMLLSGTLPQSADQQPPVKWCNGLCNGKMNTPYCTLLCLELWEEGYSERQRRHLIRLAMEKLSLGDRPKAPSRHARETHSQWLQRQEKLGLVPAVATSPRPDGSPSQHAFMVPNERDSSRDPVADAKMYHNQYRVAVRASRRGQAWRLLKGRIHAAGIINRAGNVLSAKLARRKTLRGILLTQARWRGIQVRQKLNEWLAAALIARECARYIRRKRVLKITEELSSLTPRPIELSGLDGTNVSYNGKSLNGQGDRNTSMDSLGSGLLMDEGKQSEKSSTEKQERGKRRGGFKKIVDQARSFIAPRKEPKEEKDEDSLHSSSSVVAVNTLKRQNSKLFQPPPTSQLLESPNPRNTLSKVLMKHLPVSTSKGTPSPKRLKSFSSTGSAQGEQGRSSVASGEDLGLLRSPTPTQGEDLSDCGVVVGPSRKEDTELRPSLSDVTDQSNHTSESHGLETLLPSGGLPILTLDRQLELILRECSPSHSQALTSQSVHSEMATDGGRRSFDSKQFMQMLQDGYRIHKHGRRGAPHLRTLLVNQDRGKLYWTDPSNQNRSIWRFFRRKFTSSGSYRQLDIDQIHEIRCNLKARRKRSSKKTMKSSSQRQQLVNQEDISHGISVDVASEAPIISLVTPNRSLNIEAESMDHLLYLMHGFHSLVGSKT